MNIEPVLNDLIALIKPSDPQKIVLFGSYAAGNYGENSDVDIMVVLDNDHVSKTYAERMNKKLSVRKLVLEINRKIPLDILVYSKKELYLIKEHGNYFIDEIERTGKVIYEKAG